jgi:hypothetical protein
MTSDKSRQIFTRGLTELRVVLLGQCLLIYVSEYTNFSAFFPSFLVYYLIIYLCPCFLKISS